MFWAGQKILKRRYPNRIGVILLAKIFREPLGVLDEEYINFREVRVLAKIFQTRNISVTRMSPLSRDSTSLFNTNIKVIIKFAIDIRISNIKQITVYSYSNIRQQKSTLSRAVLLFVRLCQVKFFSYVSHSAYALFSASKNTSIVSTKKRCAT